MGSSGFSCAVERVKSRWSYLPNLISLIRIGLVIPVAWSLASRQFALSVVLFALAACSDAADGFLAKRFGWQSQLGGILDPIADKLLLVTLFVALTWVELIPAWLTITAVARDLIIIGGALAYRYYVGKLTAHPSAISKLNTLLQVVFILGVIGRAGYGTPSAEMLVWLGALVFATTVVSGIDYVLAYSRRAIAHGMQRV